MQRYQPFYCEENAYWLCQDAALGAERVVLFVSNAAQSVALWQQRAAPVGEAIVWDYHVLVLARSAAEPGGEAPPAGAPADRGPWLAWDLDTRLPFPVPAARYLAATFLPVAARFRPRFRVVPAARFVTTFATDRSHMRTASGWRAPPPPWPAPHADEPPTLMRFVDTLTPFEGACHDLAGLAAFVTAAFSAADPTP